MNTFLNSLAVRALLFDCLAHAPNNPNLIEVEGIIQTYGLDSVKLSNNRDLIEATLRELPSRFFESVGGGDSFLNMCQTKDGVQWGQHHIMEALCIIAIGAGLAKWTLPKALWSTLPAQMPYFTILL